MVTADTNDLTNELIVSDLDQLVHGNTNHVLGHHDGTGDGEDLAYTMHELFAVETDVGKICGAIYQSPRHRRQRRHLASLSAASSVV